MGLIRKFLVLTVLTLLLGRYLYQPLPPGIENPKAISAYAMLLKLMLDTAMVGNALGLNGAAIQRNVLDGVVYLASKAITPRCQYTDIYIDDVIVRRHDPPNKRDGELMRTLIYFHGGGWNMGSVEMYADITDRLAADLNAIVFSVGYRLAPEHPFPAAFDDGVAVTKHVIQNAKTYGVDVMRLGLIGDSAGGNMASGILLKLRDEKFKPIPKLQVLIYPVLQMVDFNTPSWQYNDNGLVLTRRVAMEYLVNYFFGDLTNFDIVDASNHTSPEMKQRLSKRFPVDVLPDDELKRAYKPPSLQQGDAAFWKKHEKLFTNPYLNPLLEDNLKGLPPAIISSCQYDVLRDDAYFFERRLRDENISVDHLALQSCFHGWTALNHDIPQFDKAFDEIVQTIKKYI